MAQTARDARKRRGILLLTSLAVLSRSALRIIFPIYSAFSVISVISCGQSKCDRHLAVAARLEGQSGPGRVVGRESVKC